MSSKAIWAGNSVYSKFLLVVGCVLLGMMLSGVIGILAASAIYQVGILQLQNMLNNYSDPTTISMVKVIQTVSAIGTFIIPAFLLAYFFDEHPAEYLSINRRPNISSAFLVILVILASLPLINYLGELNERMSLPSFFSELEKWMKEMEDSAAGLTKSFLDMHSVSDMLYMVFMIALLPALGEELLFRGILQRLFSEWTRNIHAGIWISAVLFSAMHMQFYGFIPRMMLGALLGYLLAWSGSLWLPVIAHFINNASAVVLTYLFSKNIIELDADKIGTGDEMNVVWISVVVVAFLLLLIYRIEKNRRLENHDTLSNRVL